MNKQPKEIFNLEISSMHGSIGAEHYYGHLKWSDEKGEYQREEVLHPLTAKEAKYLNEKDNTRFSRYRAGQMDYRFETREDVREWGKKLFEKLKKTPDAILVEGSYCSASAKDILLWPKWWDTYAKRCNELSREWKAIGGYEGNNARASAIDDEYRKILND